MKNKKGFKMFIALFIAVVIVGVYSLSVNYYVIFSQENKIVDVEDVSSLGEFDAVLVLGCGVKPDGTPSRMLYERVKKGSEVFSQGNSKTLFLTGDKSGETYDEPGTMLKLAKKNGTDEKSVTIDNIGFSTYESIYNAKNIYKFKKIIIITQAYHMSRALYIASSMGLEAVGVEAYLPLYPKQVIWSLREVAARNKDFLQCIKNS